jgi:hypothetical protein
MSEVARRLVHTRTIHVEAYARDDRLWDFVASIRDTKPKDFRLEESVRPAGEPLHEMELTVTVDARMQVVQVQARTMHAPYPEECGAFAQAYQKLVGLNLMRGFREAVRDRLGGTQGCTHITELAGVLPTVAIQAFAGEVLHLNGNGQDMPPQLDRCRALRREGPVVARLYPRWHRAEGENR